MGPHCPAWDGGDSRPKCPDGSPARPTAIHAPRLMRQDDPAPSQDDDSSQSGARTTARPRTAEAIR